MISSRLKSIASLIDYQNVFDVGCDHALLDIYLALNTNYNIYASDCNKNAYNIALKNVRKYNLSDRINVVLTNGTNNLPITDDSTIILSGMGTYTIMSILNNSFLPNQIILQSNNNLKELRKYIVSIGYFIESEEIVKEGKIFNIILSCKKGKANYDEIDYELGPIIRKCEREIDKLYLKYLLEIHTKIKESLPTKELIEKEEEIINTIKNEL